MVGCRGGPFSKALFTPLFPWCPQMVGSGRRTTKKPGQGDASLLVLELFLRKWGHGNLVRNLALSYFLLRGILCPKGTSFISFCREREMMMILEAWTSDRLDRGLPEHRGRGGWEESFTCNKRVW